MDSIFYNNEKLYRAILPIEPFKKSDGSISSAAFKDKNGLSVDKQMHRPNSEAVKFIKSNRRGDIYSVTTNNCHEKCIECKYLPISENKYHSELHKDSETKGLTSSQAKHLAKNCKEEK